MTENPKAILFDVDGTLYHALPLRVLLAAWLLLAGIRHPRRTLREIRVLVHYRRALEWMRRNPSSGTHPEFQIERTAAAVGLPDPEVRECVDRWTRKAPLRLMRLCARRRLARMIKTWHRSGVPMGVYSDYPAREKLEALGLLGSMAAVLCSQDPEVGTFKPDPQGLRVLAGKIGQVPEACVYLGDRRDVDLTAAERAGMRGLLVSQKNLVWIDTRLREVFGHRSLKA